MTTLESQRSSLAMNLGDGMAFPGSQEYKSDLAAEAALKAFDADHPEVFATIKAERRAEDAKTANDKGWM